MRLQPGELAARAVYSPSKRHIITLNVARQGVSHLHWQSGTEVLAEPIIHFDAVTRLCFFRQPLPDPKGASWLKAFRERSGTPLWLDEADGSAQELRFMQWVYQIGGKVLPLGLMLVEYPGKVPVAGTPLLSAGPERQICALVLQGAGEGRFYALPAQAVHRIASDVEQGRSGKPFVGIVLDTAVPVPRIISVMPNSPAARAGLQPNDILLQIGDERASTYPQTVNALFYLQAGVEVPIQASRAGKTFVCRLLPEVRAETTAK